MCRRWPGMNGMWSSAKVAKNLRGQIFTCFLNFIRVPCCFSPFLNWMLKFLKLMLNKYVKCCVTLSKYLRKNTQKGNHDPKWPSPFDCQPKSCALATFSPRTKQNQKRKRQKHSKPNFPPTKNKPFPRKSPIDP